MTAAEILDEIRPLGKESYKRTLQNHGIGEPIFGVSIEDLKKVQKRIKKDYQLALDLYDTGIHDAQYLAGLIADDHKMTKKDLQHWADTALSAMIGEYTVPWVAAEGKHGREMGLKWIESKKEGIAASGWNTLSSLLMLVEDDALDLAEVKTLLDRVQNTIHEQPNRVRYVMNGFVIAVGCGVKPLSSAAKAAAKKIGKVSVNMGKTACKVPDAIEYIQKVEAKGTVGKKRKTVKC